MREKGHFLDPGKTESEGVSEGEQRSSPGEDGSLSWHFQRTQDLRKKTLQNWLQMRNLKGVLLKNEIDKWWNNLYLFLRDVVRIWFSNRRQSERRKQSRSESRGNLDDDCDDTSDEDDEDLPVFSAPPPVDREGGSDIQRSSVIVRNVSPSPENFDSLSAIVEQTIGVGYCDERYPDLLS